MSLRNDESKKKKKSKKKADKRYISHIWGEATVNTIATKIGLFRGLGDVINSTNFRVHRFSRFGATGGQSWGSPIGIKNGPYHTG